MIKKYKNHILFSIFLWILLFVLSFVPYNNIFSFEEKNLNPVLKTNMDLEKIEKINQILAEIDEEKILDAELKNNLNSLKSEFLKEKKLLVLENKKKEEEKKKKEEAEKIEKEKKSKEIIYPKEFDITEKMAKLHIQERKLSCEASATTDILSTILKKDILEKDILSKMKKDVTYWKPSYQKDWKIIWWDPDLWFVWEMDWHQYNLTWYAIYEKPMSEIYKEYWIKFDTYNKFENNLGLKNPKEALTYMLKELVKGNYVQIWWDYCTDPDLDDWNIDRKITTEESLNWLSQKNFCYSFYWERRVTWYTEAWKKIEAWKQSHNFVLLGYIWDIENPEKIIVRDTQTWKHVYPTTERLRKWELNDARAIIVYNENKTENKELTETKEILENLQEKSSDSKKNNKSNDDVKRKEEKDEE